MGEGSRRGWGLREGNRLWTLDPGRKAASCISIGRERSAVLLSGRDCAPPVTELERCVLTLVGAVWWVVGVGETPQKCVTSSLHLISLVSVAQGQSGDVIDRAAGQ